jgi:hypothetical protein
VIQALGPTLGLAVGIAVFPVPIIAVILMLFSPSAGRNAGAFLAGWLLGLTAVGLLALVVGIGSGGGIESGDIARVVIGALFIFFGIRKWHRRPGPDEQPGMPGWMSAVDGFGAPQAFGLGLALSALNPKNFGLTVAAVASISSAGLNPGQEVTALLVFVLIASAGVLAPSVAYLVARDRVEAGLDSARIWLVANSGTVMTVIFLVLGAVVFGDGISGLT